MRPLFHGDEIRPLPKGKSTKHKVKAVEVTRLLYDKSMEPLPTINAADTSGAIDVDGDNK